METIPTSEGKRKIIYIRDDLNVVMTKLNEQRIAGKFCDIMLKWQDNIFPAHKNVLCAKSEYFSKLVDGGFAESCQQNIDVTESFPSVEVLDNFLQFIYTSELDINRENVEDLMKTAQFLLLDKAKELIEGYLKDNLLLQNCAEITILAHTYSSEQLFELCCCIITSRLHDYFFYKDSLLDFPPEVFLKLLRGLTANAIARHSVSGGKPWGETVHTFSLGDKT